LVSLLRLRQRTAPERYELLAIHVHMDFQEGPLDRRDFVEAWCRRQGVDLRIEEVPLKAAEGKVDCFRCTWNRRKALFTTADRLGFRKVALGHHSDDLLHTALLNLFVHGRLGTMPPKREMFGGRITLIRPLALLSEAELIRFAHASGAEDGAPCPYESPYRAWVRKLWEEVERVHPQARDNLLRLLEEVGWSKEGLWNRRPSEKRGPR